MRKIKFRAWDSQRKYFIELGIGHTPLFFTYEGELKPDYNYIKLMQFTGLKDKNGKEIYEGDTVQYEVFTSDTESETGKASVVFENAAFMIDEWYLHIAETKIIGNIYENPELK